MPGTYQRDRGMLVGRNLTYVYPDNTGIISVNVSLSIGEGIVIMGPSGCGKTTLLRNLSLLDTPQKGTLKLDEIKYEFPNDAAHCPTFPYPRITMVFQQMFLWPHLKNRQNIELLLRTKPQINKYHELVDRFGVEPFLDKYPNQSSLGQRQRIAIVRSLSLLPKYILLDEATSALDSKLTQSVSEVLLDAKAGGLGFIVITHDHRFARLLGGKIMYMEHGRFVEEIIE